MIKIVKVTNNSGHAIERGGRVFPPFLSIQVSISSEYKLAEIEGCSRLKVEEVVSEKLGEYDEEERIEESFECPHCDFVAKSKAGLTTHINSRHKEV